MLVFQFLIMRERLASLILNGGRQSKLITRILTDALFFSDTFHPEQAPVTYGQKKAHYRGHINFGCGERGISSADPRWGEAIKIDMRILADAFFFLT